MNKDQNRKLSAILFADIVDYTALMQSDEQKAALMLKLFQKEIKEKVEEQNGRIVNFYGDGALAVFDSPLQAMQCAMQLQQGFSFSSTAVPVRIGVHSGTVVFDEDQIYGDSVNLTSRIESMGVAGSVLLSERVRRDIKNYPEFQIKSLGFFEFKNVEEPMEVLALANEGLVIPTASELKGKIKTKPALSRLIKVLPWFLLLVFVASAFWYFASPEKKLSNPSANQKFISYLPTEGKTIAVLPFANLSEEESNQYFCDGMMEDILLNLAKIKSLKVISRTSVLQYRDTEKPLPDIASELGVEYLVEGSVRRSGDQVKITVQLIHGPTDHHQWAESYTNRLNLENIFDTQGAIAESIVKEVKASISPEESKSLYNQPTLNQKAYDHFLKGRGTGWSAEGQRSAIPFFKAAIKEDPNFAEAYIGLSRVYRQQWTHFGQGKDYLDSALTVFHKVEIMYPNHSAIFEEKASLLFIQGKLEEAIPLYLKAVELNPNNFDAINNLGWVNISLGNYPETLRWANTFFHRAKNTSWFGSWFAMTINVFLDLGDIEKVKELLHLRSADMTLNREVNMNAFRLALLEENKERALDLARKVKEVHPDLSLRFYSQTYYQFEDYDNALNYYKQYKAAYPDGRIPEEFLGSIYYYTGEKEKAATIFDQVEQGVLGDIASDNQNKYQRIKMANIHALQGKKLSAISWLEQAFEQGYCNVVEIEQNRNFDAIRAFPEYRQLLQMMKAKIEQMKAEIINIQLDFLNVK